MSFLSFKESFIKSGLLEDTTDIHCHILPGVDDGISCNEEAVIALRWLKTIGVNHIYLTPHVMSDFPKNTFGYLSETFNHFIKKLKEDGIDDIPELKPGAEYMLEAAFEKHKNEELFTYTDRHLLVETSYMTPPIGFVRILEKLQEDGYTPILAHPERYIYMDMTDYEYLKSQGVKFQLNYLSITGSYGRQAKEKATQLLKAGHYNYTGSDFHHLARHNKSFAAKALTKKQIAMLKPLFDNNKNL